MPDPADPPRFLDVVAQRWYEDLFIVALGTVRDPQVASEVVHDTFIKVLEADPPPQFTHPEAAARYMKRAVKRQSLNRRRSRGRRARREVPLDDVTVSGGLGSPVAGSPEDAYLEAEDLQRIRSRMQGAAERLPPDLREVLDLHRRGRNTQQIADALGVRARTIRRRIARIRSRNKRS